MVDPSKRRQFIFALSNDGSIANRFKLLDVVDDTAAAFSDWVITPSGVWACF
jgi:hypothetical protein